MIKIRCSSLPRFFECASSELESAAPYDPNTEPAELGTAVHKGLGHFIREGTNPDLTELAGEYDQDLDEVRMLYFNGRKAWKAIKAQLPDPLVEQRVESRLIHGTADVIFWNGEVLIIVDWKSGYVQSNYHNQLAGYAHGAVATFGMPTSRKVVIVTVWLRQGEVDTAHLDAEDLEKWEARYEAQIACIGRQYSPSDDSCIGCKRQLNCQAREEFIRSAALSLAPYENDQLAVPRETLGALYPKAKILERALDSYKTALRMTIQIDGPLIVGETKQLELREYTKILLDPRKSWPVMKAFGLLAHEINAVLRLSRDKLMKIVAGKAPPQAKGQAKDDCLAALKEADAVTEIRYTKLAPVKRTKEITDGKARDESTGNS